MTLRSIRYGRPAWWAGAMLAAALPLSLAPAGAGIRRVAEPAVSVVMPAQKVEPAADPTGRRDDPVKRPHAPAPGPRLDTNDRAPLLPFRQSEGICAATTVCEVY